MKNKIIFQHDILNSSTTGTRNFDVFVGLKEADWGLEPVNNVSHLNPKMAERGVRVQGSQGQAKIGNINSPSVVSLNSACR